MTETTLTVTQMKELAAMSLFDLMKLAQEALDARNTRQPIETALPTTQGT